MQNISDAGMILTGAALALLIGLAILGSYLWRKPPAQNWIPPTPAASEIARIAEHSEFSAGGGACVVFLVLFTLGSFVGYYSAGNVMQQMLVALNWIGWCILFGAGAVIGRRRTYVVTRNAPADDQTRHG